MQTAVYANESFLQLSGYSISEVQGRDMNFLHGPETDPAAFARLLSPVDGPRFDPCEVLVYRKDGTPFWDRITGRVLGSYFVQVHLEIGRQKEIENQLLLSQTREVVGRLVSGISHDFNNLLTAIMVYTGLLAPAVDGDPQARRYLDEVRASAERGSHLVAQMLDLEREEPLSFTEVAAGALVEDMRDLLMRVLGENIRLTINAGAGLAKVRTNPERLQQAILNMSINSRDAMPHGGDLIISVSNFEVTSQNQESFPGASPGRYVLILVSDTGEGMSPGVQAQIFQPFFSTKPRGKGTGLGLYTVHAFAQQSGGKVYVESHPGTGTAFRLLLPAVSQAGAETPAVVLLVEDEELVRRSVEAALEVRGYEVLSAASAEEAMHISSAFAGRIHLMLSDLVMPGLSGLELLDKIRVQRPDIRVLLMSGYSLATSIPDGDLFRKPFTPSALVERIEQELNHAAREKN